MLAILRGLCWIGLFVALFLLFTQSIQIGHP
jgi:hypothetical protein